MRIGQAYLSSGGDYTHLANNHYYNGSAWVGTSGGCLYQQSGQTHAWYKYDGAGTPHTLLMSLDSSGNFSVIGDITAFYTPSDKNWKDNITPINDPLAKVLSISGNTFDWNEKSNQGGKDIGVVAQEVLEVLPEAVVEREDGHLSVAYHKIIPLLVEAIKELSHKVEVLEQKLQDK